MGDMTDVEWDRIKVRTGTTVRVFYKAWKTGHPGLVGYGLALDDAIAAMLNKHGE